jgi:type IX secretion system PorP/SprF family membrane protein
MRLLFSYIFLFLSLSALSQQFPHYTQFLFNKIGYNPAASGTSVNAPFELIAGARTQWIGMNNNPKSQFVSFNYNFIPQHGYNKWHNVGVYIDQDLNGVFVKNDLWLSYTIHLLATKKTIISAGVFAGIKYFKISASQLDRNDPAVSNSSSAVIGYPDLIPGVRLTTKKFFADFALQQVSIFKQKGIGGQIGSPSKLRPHYNLSAGKKVSWNDFNTLMIATNIRGNFLGMPSVELNVMNYYSRKFAAGMSLRNLNFICGIIQFRFIHNVNIGLAYDLSVGRILRAAPHTVEVMVSISPLFGGEPGPEKSIRRYVDDCSF